MAARGTAIALQCLTLGTFTRFLQVRVRFEVKLLAFVEIQIARSLWFVALGITLGATLQSMSLTGRHACATVGQQMMYTICTHNTVLVCTQELGSPGTREQLCEATVL